MYDMFTLFEISQFDKGKDQEINGICELNSNDFSTLLWSIDPTISKGQSNLLFELCVEETFREMKNNVGHVSSYNDNDDNDENDVELDEISCTAFLKVCENSGLLKTFCKTYGKRPHTTGGRKIRKIQERKKLLNKVGLLSSLNPKQIHQLASKFQDRTFNEKDVIVTQGDIGNEFYIIKNGNVDIFMSKMDKESKKMRRKLVSTLDSGQFFGEKALLTNEPRNADCVAKTDVVECLVLTRASFESALGSLSSILEAQAKQFSIMSRDWSEIHEPRVQKWCKDNNEQLKVWQDQYKIGEKEVKPGLITLIDPLTESIKLVNDMEKKLNELLKSRTNTDDARKCITKLLILIEEQDKKKKKVENSDDEDDDEEEDDDNGMEVNYLEGNVNQTFK
jgi:hypothetical protein